MRIDKLLWFLRLSKTRALAQAMVEQGHIRLNRKRVERAHHKVAAGDILVIPQANLVRAIRILALPKRRGPAVEAKGCYQVLDGGEEFLIAAAESYNAAEGDLQP